MSTDKIPTDLILFAVQVLMKLTVSLITESCLHAQMFNNIITGIIRSNYFSINKLQQKCFATFYMSRFFTHINLKR